jgi:hypothetical protein
METIGRLLPALACAGGMAACMYLMRRGKQRAPDDTETNEELAVLRAEVAQLRDEQKARSSSVDG